MEEILNNTSELLDTIDPDDEVFGETKILIDNYLDSINDGDSDE